MGRETIVSLQGIQFPEGMVCLEENPEEECNKDDACSKTFLCEELGEDSQDVGVTEDARHANDSCHETCNSNQRKKHRFEIAPRSFRKCYSKNSFGPSSAISNIAYD